MQGIPAEIRNNPHILRRLNVYVAPTRSSIPQAARTTQQIRSREIPPLDPYTAAVLNNEVPAEPPTVEQLRQSSAALRLLQHEYVNQGKYDLAKAACIALRRVNQDLRAQTTFDRDKADIEQLISKRNELIALVQSTNDDWNTLLGLHAEDTRGRLGTLADEQEAELRRFDADVPTELPPLFKRNSVTYLQMRSKERHLANTERFDEAIDLQRAADMLEARERQENFEKMDKFFRGRRDRLQELQDRALSASAEWAVRKRDEMAGQRDRAVRGQQNRIESLERQIVRKCEQRGITQGQLNLDLVDEERIALVRARENENPVSHKRSATRRTRAENEEEEVPQEEPKLDDVIAEAATGENKEEEKKEK
jgi:hypothetical protein